MASDGGHDSAVAELDAFGVARGSTRVHDRAEVRRGRRGGGGGLFLALGQELGPGGDGEARGARGVGVALGDVPPDDNSLERRRQPSQLHRSRQGRELVRRGEDGRGRGVLEDELDRVLAQRVVERDAEEVLAVAGL